MASAKILTLAIRTLAKPIATQIKSQAASHECFRKVCISLAQFMHRTEMAWRSNLLASGKVGKHEVKVRPLNDAKAIQNGANALSEAFLFAIAAGLILGETYRGNRKAKARRNGVEDDLRELRAAVRSIAEKLDVQVELSEDEPEEGTEEEANEHAGGKETPVEATSPPRDADPSLAIPDVSRVEDPALRELLQDSEVLRLLREVNEEQGEGAGNLHER